MQANPSSAAQTGRETLLRLPQVEAIVGLRKSSIYEMMGRNPPAFPPAIKLSRRAVCWNSSSIESWVQDRIKGAAQ